MHATRLSPYFSCIFTRLGNSFMHGWQLVDHASRTTIFFPLWADTSFRVSSQVTVSSETFAFFSPGSFAAVFFSGFSSAEVCTAATSNVTENRTATTRKIVGLIMGKLPSTFEPQLSALHSRHFSIFVNPAA